LKMKFLTDLPKTFQLIETMLCRPDGEFWLLDRHMQRLSASAKYFAYRFDEKKVKATLVRAVKGHKGKTLRVRMTLAEDGDVQVSVVEIAMPRPDTSMRFVVSNTVLDSKNPFLFHKTTRRELYDREWAQYSENTGSDEVLYFNRQGHLCEGSRTNVFIKREGMLLTPPLEDGLLPGTFRAELIAKGKAIEATLTRQDLEDAVRAKGSLFVGNSVRGLVKAVPVEE